MTYTLIGGKYINKSEEIMGKFSTYSNAEAEVKLDKGRYVTGYTICGKSFDYYRIDCEAL